MSDLIGPELHGGRLDPPCNSISPGWIAGLSFTVAVGLLLNVLGNGAGLRGSPLDFPLYWSGIGLVLVPATLRVCRPLVARGERLFIVLLMGLALLFVKTVYYPLNFSAHDEFLHWNAAYDLIAAERLFLTNPLLEVQATYPSLEIVTTALVQITGTSVFVAGSVLLLVLRLTFVSSLFLLLEKITGSARIAGIGCVVYMGCPTFLFFEGMFSYESLGIVLCALAFAIEAGSLDQSPRQRFGSLLLIGMVLASLAVTHHLSSAFGAIYFGGLALTESIRRGPMHVGTRVLLVAVAGLAVALPVLWIGLRGNEVASYLGPLIQRAYKVLLTHVQTVPVTHTEAPKQLPKQPIFMRVTTILGLLLVTLCLATGFFRSWGLAVDTVRPGWPSIMDILRKRHWRDSRLIFLTILAFGFPLSVALRLTAAGWEVGNRMGSFTFFAVSLLVGVSIVHFWQRQAPRGWRLHVPSAFVAIIVMSGATSATIDPIRGKYRVIADAESIETMGVETALWTKEWLGPGNRFTSDRVNRLLLAGYGRQDVRIDVSQGVTAGRIFVSDQLNPDDRYALATGDVDFLLSDLRNTMAVPVMGYYYEPWENNAGTRISASSLLKFNDVDGVARIYDNGFQIIYDVRALHAHR